MRGKRKVLKFMLSYQKERKWLEMQAQRGWFLSDISMGVLYTFTGGEPKRMLYDIDRFNLSKKPTLEEIRRKELFLEMAQELGWQEITHDESLTYYFAKEYEEDGINELCNDADSRRYRAEKFRSHLVENAKKLCFWAMVIVAVNLFERLLQLSHEMQFLNWFDWFTYVYVLVGNGMAVAMWRLSESCSRELSMTRQEWEESVNPASHRTVRKLILTNRGLNRFLSRQAAEGWCLTGVTPTRYFFERNDSGSRPVYTMDSKWLVNQRRKAQSRQKIGDGKDWNGMNNDWEIQSIRDAEEKGWSFACALENRSIIYKGEEGCVQPLNDGRYDNSLRFLSLIGEYSAILLLCGILGGICGFIMGMCNLQRRLRKNEIGS